ncbi:uncharacterized protein SPAPADRAFT_61690 [Spathaspora passalidarum NRRL Y-27907]|uniref:AMP-activated protein kinase glycogen-binding domain-containing protein n=1 Tax=Spathaspora passalidarum (strain NRRL Y-27907 / 11-Y1) TaxID=619300 RepID=G3AP58_SPAPN|nr:uncharacterized protein SPAPADRAFT_61690 [Spathaspora passalidarum NRRL Y-27907]EGW32629.1 hypothetical protein SPAPADRAFT_61690 [Spathaspora passalidarum NRRL Y-27907]
MSYTFKWPSGPQDVVVTGSFVNWTENIPLVKQADGSFSLEVPFASSTEPILYKYVVDGVWQASQDEKITKDDSGIENNILDVDDLKALSTKAKSIIPESGLSVTQPELSTTVLPKEELKQVSVAGEPGIQIPTQPEALAAFNEVRDVDPATLNKEESPATSELTAEERKKLKKKVKRTQYKAKKKKKAAEGGAEASTEEDTEKEQTPEPLAAPVEAAVPAGINQVTQEAKAVVSEPASKFEEAKNAVVSESSTTVKAVEPEGVKEAVVSETSAAVQAAEPEGVKDAVISETSAVKAAEPEGIKEAVVSETSVAVKAAEPEGVKEAVVSETSAAVKAAEPEGVKEAVVSETSGAVASAGDQIKTLDPKATEPAEGKEVDASPVVKDEAPKTVEDEEEIIIAEGDKDAIAAAIAAGHTLEEVEPTEEQKAKLAGVVNGAKDAEGAKETAETAAKKAESTAKKAVNEASKKEVAKEEKKKGGFRRFLKKVFS